MCQKRYVFEITPKKNTKRYVLAGWLTGWLVRGVQKGHEAKD